MHEEKKSIRVQLLIQGRVQGVGYRAFAYTEAVKRQLAGRVQNLDDGRVEVEVQGPEDEVDAYIQILNRGPKLAKVDQVEVNRLPSLTKNHGFVIDY